MFKKLLFVLVLVSPLFCQGMVVYPAGMNKENTSSFKKQFGIDYHGVVTKKSKPAYYWALAKAVPALATAAVKMGYTYVTGKQINVSQAYKEINEIKSKEAKSSGEAIINILQRHELCSLAQFIFNVKNSYKPYEPMIAIMKSLKAQNIPMRLASNMGPQILKSSQDMLKNHSLFKGELLEQGQIVSYSQYGKSNPVECTEILCETPKPAGQYYDSLKANFIKDNEIMIVVDDKKSNVEMAAQQGLIGIHFDDKKADAIETFKKNLKELGIKL
jgi:FMN phosphatase YigB (HAD superfamily)